MEELKDEILEMAQTLRDKISELTDMDEFNDSVIAYQKLNDALCDFIGDY